MSKERCFGRVLLYTHANEDDSCRCALNLARNTWAHGHAQRAQVPFYPFALDTSAPWAPIAPNNLGPHGIFHIYYHHNFRTKPCKLDLAHWFSLIIQFHWCKAQ